MIDYVVCCKLRCRSSHEVSGVYFVSTSIIDRVPNSLLFYDPLSFCPLHPQIFALL